MRILLTGGCGFIGGHVVDLAIRQGHYVEVIDAITYSGNMRNLPWRFQGLRPGDVTDQVLMMHLVRQARPDVVIHMAAETHVCRSINQVDPFILTNVSGTHSMLEAVRSYWTEAGRPDSFRYIQISTDEVFGDLGPDEHPWTEQSRYAPRNPYSASKAAADHMVRAFANTYGLPAIIIHPANAFGIRQHPEKLIATLLLQSIAGLPLTLHGDGLNVREWTSVEDIADGILIAAERGTPGQRYLLGSETPLNNLQVAQLVAPDHPHRLVQDRPGNDRRYAMDCSRTRAALGWAPTRTLAGSIEYMRTWYRVEAAAFAAEYGRGARRFS